MNDTSSCPICSSKLKCAKRNFPLPKIPSSSFIEKRCVNFLSHSFQIFVDSNKIKLLRLSFERGSSVYVEVDYHNATSAILCYKNSKLIHSLTVPKIMEIDFPSLFRLKEKVYTYLTLI